MWTRDCEVDSDAAAADHHKQVRTNNLHRTQTEGFEWRPENLQMGDIFAKSEGGYIQELGRCLKRTHGEGHKDTAYTRVIR